MPNSRQMGRVYRIKGLLGSTMALWMAGGVYKLTYFGFSLKMGRLGGAEVLGVMASLFVVAWLLGTAAGLGLCDWVPFRTAEDVGRGVQPRRQIGVAHGLFLLSFSMANLLLLCLSPFLAAAPAYLVLSVLLVLGAGANGVGAFGLAALRGAGRPGVEVVVHLLASAVLAIGVMWATTPEALALSWLVAGSSHVLGGVFIVPFLEPRLRPVMVSMREIVPMVKESTFYLGLGLGSYLLGNMDLLLARAFCSTSQVGYLVVATVLIRAGSVAPWVAATLLLHRFERRWAQGRTVNPFWLLGAALVLVSIVGSINWFALPLLAIGYQLSSEDLISPARMAILCSPALFCLLSILPLAAAKNLRTTLGSMAAGLLSACLVGSWLLSPMGTNGAIIAAGLGQVVAFVTLMLRLGSQNLLAWSGRSATRHKV